MLNRFLKKNDLTCEDLYQKQLAIQRAITIGDMEPYENHWLPDLIKDFMREMKADGKSDGYTRQIITAVKFFLKTSAMTLSIDSEDIPNGEDTGKAVISHIQIDKIWDRCRGEFKLRNRALIAMIKDSGLRPIDVFKLDVKDFLTALDESPYPGFAKFRCIITSKTGTKGYPRIGPEAVEALNLYLNGRETGPLFESKQRIAGSRKMSPHLKRMTTDDIGSIFATLTKELKNGDQIAAYSLRKFHSTKLNSAKPELELESMSESYIAILQGKKRQGTFGPYNKPQDTGELMDEYVRHYPKLTLNPEFISTWERFDIQKQTASNEKRIDELTKLVEKLLAERE
ncbi:hypothetical protein ES703_72376 [subsurface metagenome]